jgi:hypothetical protein
MNDIKSFDFGHMQKCPFWPMPLHFRNASAAFVPKNLDFVISALVQIYNSCEMRLLFRLWGKWFWVWLNQNITGFFQELQLAPAVALDHGTTFTNYWISGENSLDW